MDPTWTYFKNIAAHEPTADMLLAGGETITITCKRSKQSAVVGHMLLLRLFESTYDIDCHIYTTKKHDNI